MTGPMAAAMDHFGVERRAIRPYDVALVAWIVVLAGVTIYGAATTTGFLTVSNLKAILTAASFVGIIAVGLTVIVLTGNLFSLALGQTAAVSAMVFLYSLRIGLTAAIILTLVLGLAIGAVQGFAVGAWGSEPDHHHDRRRGTHGGNRRLALHGESIVPPASETSWERLAQPVSSLPAPVYVFIALTVVLALVMRRTRFGRQIYLLGENRAAAPRGRAADRPPHGGCVRHRVALHAGCRHPHRRDERERLVAPHGGATPTTPSPPLSSAATPSRVAGGRSPGRPSVRSSSRRSPTCFSCAATRPESRSSCAASSSSSSSC